MSRLARLRRRLRRLQAEVLRVQRRIVRLRRKDADANTVSEAGVKFVSTWEGFYPHLYDDPVGYATVGFGHLVAYKPVAKLSAKERKPWVKGLTRADALELLRKDLAEYSDAVRDYVRVPLNQNQHDALTSFAYNLGTGALAGSTLLKKINAKAPSGEIRGEFAKWVKAGSPPITLPGLVRRRAAEADLYFRR